MVNWDALLAYDTVKIVRIQNAKLGALHYLLMLFIIAYIIGWNVLYEKRYLRTETPMGSVRLSLRPPCSYPPYECESVKVPQNYTCNRTPADKLPYCLQHSQLYPNTTFGNMNCTYFDDNLVLYPPMLERGLFATTRVRQDKKILNCSISDYDCQYTVVDRELFYIAEVERFTLQLDHTMYAPELGIQFNADSLFGRLYDSKGNEVEMSYPNIVGKRGCKDTFELQTLLKAAGLSTLDQQFADANETLRSAGVILILFISYSNTKTYNLNYFEYEYKLDFIENTEFKVEQSIYDENLNDILLWSRHGIRLLVLQSGIVGKFDFQVLLLTFVSGLGLMAAATVIVDFLATKVLPNRHTYYMEKYQEVDSYEHLENEKRLRDPLRSESERDYSYSAMHN